MPCVALGSCDEVATLAWNGWQLWRGISGNFGVEYAPAAQESSESDYSNTVLPKMANPVRLVGVGIPVDEDVAVSADTKAQLLSDTSDFGNTVIQQKPSAKRLGRPATMREPILALLRSHPEGLTAEQIRGYLNAQKPIGDTLQGLRRSQLVKTEGTGREMRYFLG
jgi:hypothetical protein